MGQSVRAGVIPLLIGWALLGLVRAIEAQSSSPAATAPIRESNNPLPGGVLYQLGNSCFRADCNLSTAMFSPDGKFLAALDYESTIWIWSVESGQLTKKIEFGVPRVKALWFSEQSPELHCYAEMYNPQVYYVHRHWRVTDWTELPSIAISDSESAALKRRWNAHHARELVIGNDGVVVYDVSSGRELLKIPPSPAVSAWGGTLSDDGKLLLLVALGSPVRIELWDVDRRMSKQWAQEESLFNHVALGANDSIVGASGKGAQWWDLKTGHEIARAEAGELATGGLRFSPDGKQVAIPYEGRVLVCDVATGKRIWSLPAPGYDSELFFSADGRLLGVQGMNPVVLVFDLRTGHELHPHESHMSSVFHVEYALNGKRLATVDRNGYMTLWDLSARKPIGAVSVNDGVFGPFEPPKSRLSGDGRVALIRRSTAMPWLWKVDHGPYVRQEESAQGEHFIAAGSRSGAFLAAIPDGTLEFAEVNLPDRPHQGSLRHYRGSTAETLAVALSADASVAASLADDQTLTIWKPKVETPPVIAKLPRVPRPLLAMSDDGTQVAAIMGSQLSVWKSTGGDPVASIALDEDKPSILQFAPDGKTLALGTASGRIRLFGAVGGKLVAERTVHAGPVTALSFSLDAVTLYSGGRDGAVIGSKLPALERTDTIGDKQSPILALAVLASDKKLAISEQSGPVVIWDLAAHKKADTIPREIPTQVLFTFPDGDGFGTLQWNQNSLQFSVNSTAHRNGFGQIPQPQLFNEAVAISPDGKLVARATPAGIRTWTTATATRGKSFLSRQSLTGAIAFSPSGRLIAAGGEGFGVWKVDDQQRCWDAAESKTGQVTQLLFSPDERWLLSAAWDDSDMSQLVKGGPESKVIPYLSWDREVELWDVASATLVRSIRLPRRKFGDFDFTGDSRLLAAIVPDQVYAPDDPRPGLKHMVLWEIASGQEIGPLALPYPRCSSYTFSADGAQLALGLPTGNIWVCDFSRLLGPFLIGHDPGDSPPLGELWNRLGAAEPVVAFRAIQRMCEQPDAAVNYLRDRLQTSTATQGSNKPAQAEIRQLIEQLGGNDPSVQRRASSRLLKLGPSIQPELRAALQGNPPDQVRGRLELILAAKPIDVSDDAPAPATTLRSIRSVQVLERIANPGAKELLKFLSSGQPQSEVTQEARAAEQRLASSLPK